MSHGARFPGSATLFAGLSAEILQQGKFLRFQAHGTSMQPLLRDGDTLLVSPLDGKAARAGDIILCTLQPGRVLVHRVLRRMRGKEGWQYLVQGDQSGKPDGIIPQAQVHGRVTGIERKGMPISMRQGAAIILGWWVVLRSRWHIDHVGWVQGLSNLARRFPVFSRYVSKE